jgi:DNA-binding transcriptional ArsR family regulator
LLDNVRAFLYLEAVRETLTISRPDQLKALGHPLRLRVLETLGADDDTEEMTNRELAQRLGVDPGHLHFHVRMLLNAGLIELAERSGGREKPYRAVARHVRVAPELIATGAANDAREAMLDQVRQGWAEYATNGRFRSAQLNVRLDPDQVRELFRQFVERAVELEDESNESLLVSFFSHPPPTATEPP